MTRALSPARWGAYAPQPRQFRRRRAPPPCGLINPNYPPNPRFTNFVSPLVKFVSKIAKKIKKMLTRFRHIR